jgi:hypothetical protein
MGSLTLRLIYSSGLRCSDGRRRAGLPERVRAGEGLVLHAGIHDPPHGREWREIQFE